MTFEEYKNLAIEMFPKQKALIEVTSNPPDLVKSIAIEFFVSDINWSSDLSRQTRKVLISLREKGFYSWTENA